MLVSRLRRALRLRYSTSVRPARAASVAILLLSGMLPAQTWPEGSWTEEILDAHNRVRAQTGAPPLTWSDQLAAVAQQWADYLLRSGEFCHRTPSRFGENLFEIRGRPAPPTLSVDRWAAEAADYDAGRNSCRSGVRCGHYTQIIWRATKRVGCAVARAGNREVWVCNYDPPGNVIGQRP